MIEVKQISKKYDSVTAVDTISFDAKPGEIFGLIGPNGAGKSTTIRMIMNIIVPDSGEIWFGGKPITIMDKDHIGYLPEERGLPKKAIVNDVLLYFASLKGAKKQETQIEIDRWLNEFNLMEWKNKKVDQLSKGMAQKIQFICAVAHKPDLLFFDEPFSGLDPVSQEILLKAMLILRDEGKTVLFSTHVMEHAEKIASSIFLINKGREIAKGPISDVKKKYGKNTVQIEFDGDANFVKSLSCVKSITHYPRWIEAELADTQNASTELYSALSGKLNIKRFQLMEPSLHKIFINLVGNDNGLETKVESNE